MLRSLALVVFGVGAGILLAGCPDYVEYDGLYLTNLTENPVRAYAVLPDGSELHISTRDPESTGEIFRLYLLDLNADNCTDFPISVRRRGKEIERFEPPVCWDDGYEILAVREPQG